MIEKITNQNQIARHKLAEKINEVIDWINDVSALRITNNQVTANLPNIDAGELAFLSKENTELKDKIDILETKLERTRKALDVARHTIGWINQMIDEHTDKQAIKIKCEYALEQITAPEQKD